MTDFLVVLKKLRSPFTIVGLAVILLAGLVWLYINYREPFLVSRDQFRFLKIIDAYYSGNLTWQDFFTSHSEHVKPAYLLFFFLNAIYLGLNIRLELFLGLVALCGTAFVLVNQYRQSMDLHRSDMFISITSLILIVQLFSFNQDASYDFSLLMLGGYSQLLLFFLTFREANSLWLHRKDNMQLIRVVMIIFIATFSFAGARMPVLVLALLVSNAILVFLEKAERDRLIKHGGIIAASGMVAIGVYMVLTDAPSINKGADINALQTLVKNPQGAWTFFTSAISASVLPAMYLRGKGWWAQEFAIAGTAIFFSMLLVLYFYFRRELWRQSLMPLTMVLYGWGFVAAITVARFGKDFPIQTAWMPRYIFDTQVAAIGVLWMLLLLLGNGAVLNRQKVCMLLFLGAFAVTYQGAIFTGAWNKAVYGRRTWERAEIILRSEAKKEGAVEKWPQFLCPNPQLCKQGVHTLSKYKLNIFQSDSELVPER